MTIQATFPPRAEVHTKRKELTEETQLMIAYTIITFIVISIATSFFVMKNHYIEHKYDDVIGQCRIQYEFKNDDGKTAYLCSNRDMPKSEYIVIEKGEPRRVDQNAYINRPVKIFKDGTVE